MERDERIRENLATVRQQIADAAACSGRSAADVTLVAVTKYVDTEVARALAAAGCHNLGESRPQELWRKAAALADLPIRWHLIGHLQSNKARRTLPLVGLLHSVDSTRLIHELERTASDLGIQVEGLIEVNISGDATKHGFAPNEVEAALAACANCAHLRIQGLMGMASREGDLDAAQREFASLRELRDRLRRTVSAALTLPELSMGMSGDFKVAIREGATLVRVGSRLFDGLSL
ncbi:MAG: YggS family pyridoxal phosphate-dependent enzyme [Planctomycetaceae bacterium]|nr:YggS family pyridoxal phosphate-dependent enzyme [Planctomycetaceae bacterium]